MDLNRRKFTSVEKTTRQQNRGCRDYNSTFIITPRFGAEAEKQSDQMLIKPRCMAQTTTSARLRTWVLRKMLRTWFLMVFSDNSNC